MTLPILISLFALLLAFRLAWRFFRPRWTRDLCAGQVWTVPGTGYRYEIVRIDPAGDVTYHKYRGYGVDRTIMNQPCLISRAQFRTILKNGRAILINSLDEKL